VQGGVLKGEVLFGARSRYMRGRGDVCWQCWSFRCLTLVYSAWMMMMMPFIQRQQFHERRSAACVSCQLLLHRITLVSDAHLAGVLHCLHLLRRLFAHLRADDVFDAQVNAVALKLIHLLMIVDLHLLPLLHHSLRELLSEGLQRWAPPPTRLSAQLMWE
jgi:hypothetical protein